ncbi:nuclear transport factor 2 family protein [Novosphingobium piscinae]|uniref:Nuclear transport factor 2 family protein n=1 Tax=Novosphingobium piscinae TaxID=1507448 RepID=A0A7X1G0R4_9SPHN|nr:nuclear transport factor 2 family protein [Novosphingobium piscinae]MBC2670508.1 nuclear transport factor 2 family protein [Novosphingobium piscinae]
MSDPDDLAIRLRRATFNRALAGGDLAAIGPLLARDVVLVTGTDSAVLAGRKAQLQAWQREFAVPPAARQRYVRTPATITLSAAAPVALEQGAWTCTVGEAVTAAGSYAAKWRKVDADWVIEAEIFVTLA